MVLNVYATSVTAESISRHELLAWVNDCLQSNLTRIEEMSTGAAYCQLSDFLFPGQISLKKVKWNSRNQPDWVSNWQILQTAWKRIGVDKPVPVERLMKAKFQDNFEFLQWFRKLFDANYDGREYDPLEARNYEALPAALPAAGNTRIAKNTSSGPVAPPVRRVAAPVASTNSRPVGQRASNGSSAPVTTRPNPPAVAAAKKTAPSAKPAGQMSSAVAEPAIDSQVVKELEDQMNSLAITIGSLEKERDFYFSKLRQIEMLCSEVPNGVEEPSDPDVEKTNGNPAAPIAPKMIEVSAVLEILYATEDGFSAPAGEEIEESGDNIENTQFIGDGLLDAEDPADISETF